MAKVTHGALKTHSGEAVFVSGIMGIIYIDDAQRRSVSPHVVAAPKLYGVLEGLVEAWTQRVNIETRVSPSGNAYQGGSQDGRLSTQR